MSHDFPEDTLPSMAIWLIRHRAQVRRHEAAADIAAEVTAAVRAATRAIDRPPQRVYAGPCPVCGTDLLTWPARTQVTCTGCGTTHNIAERQDSMRTQLDDYLGTATYAAAILPGIGIHVSAGTIRMWASRRRLEVRTVVPAHATGPEQHLYRLGDIIDLALARATLRCPGAAHHGHQGVTEPDREDRPCNRLTATRLSWNPRPSSTPAPG